MVLLAIDTSSNTLSVALLNNTDTFFIERQMLRGQGEALIPLIQELLKQANLDVKSIDRIAVAVGPGSFTGVRIAISTARAFALALNVPVCGVTNLKAFAHHLNQPVTVALDSKRDDFFVQHFDEKGLALDEPHIETMEQLKDSKTPVVSDVPHVFVEAGLKTLTQPLALAVCVCEIAKKRMDNPLPATPLYLRQADVTV